MQRNTQHHNHVRLFGNPALEALTVMSATAFMIIWAILLPAILVAAVVFAPTLWAPVLVVAGIGIWTFTEYALHRFVFHFAPRSALFEKFVFLIHGNHHTAPNDPLRNLMPLVVSAPIAAVVWLLMVAAIGPEGTWSFLGFMAGYVFYDLLHYACHQWPMKSRLARMFKVHHMRHHHLKADGNYAITGIFWDSVLATRLRTKRTQP